MDVDRRSFLKFLGLSGAAAGVAVASAAAVKVEKVIPEGKTGILKTLMGKKASLEEKRAKDHERWLTFDKMKATVNPTRFAKKSA